MAVVMVSGLIILKKELTMKKLLQHIGIHLLVSLGLENAGQILSQFGYGVAFAGGYATASSVCVPDNKE